MCLSQQTSWLSVQLFWWEKPPAKWRNKQIKISGASSLLRAQKSFAKEGNLPRTAPKWRGLHQCASSSPKQKMSFASVSLAALPTNMSSSGQESTCWVTHSCHGGSQGGVCGCKTACQQEQCFAMVGAPLLKVLMSLAGMTSWQKSGLSGGTSFLLPIPHNRCCCSRNQGSCCPKYLPCLPMEDRKTSCLLLQNGHNPGQAVGKCEAKASHDSLTFTVCTLTGLVTESDNSQKGAQ